MSRRFEPDWRQMWIAFFILTVVFAMWGLSGKEEVDRAASMQRGK